EVEWYSDLAPGQYVAMEYEGDDVDHERILLHPLGGGVWWIRTPDGDEYFQDVACQDASDGPVRCRLLPADGSLPPGARGRGRRKLYRFAERVGALELREGILRGRRACEAECRPGQRPVVPERVQEPAGELMPIERFFGGSFPPAPGVRLRGKKPLTAALVARPRPEVAPGGAATPEATEAEEPAADALPLLAGHAWALAEPVLSAAIGSEVDIRKSTFVGASDTSGLIFVGDGFARARRMPVEDVPEYADTRTAELRRRLWLPGAGAEADLRDRLARPPLPPPAEAPAQVGEAAAAPIKSEDVRLLAVDFDGQGERFKPRREAVHESSQEEFSDQPMDAPPSALTTCKSMLRVGGDPRLWLREYLREKGLASADRVAHELRCICEALYMAGCYDQVNLGGLMALEVFCKRLEGIVAAHANPQRVQWEVAKYYAGVQSAEDVAGPLLRAHVARKIREDREGLQALRGAPSGAQEGDLGAGGGGGAGRGAGGEDKGGGGGRGRGDGGRGMANDALKALSWMAGWKEFLWADRGPDVLPDDVQVDVQRRACELVDSWRPRPPQLSDEAALKKLLQGHSPYQAAGCPTRVTSFKLDLLSLP
ncbi:unnamed protein product, partial [Prorocentrum cordatum]